LWQDPLVTKGPLVPLLGVDVWEHAYYLQVEFFFQSKLCNVVAFWCLVLFSMWWEDLVIVGFDYVWPIFITMGLYVLECVGEFCLKKLCWLVSIMNFKIVPLCCKSAWGVQSIEMEYKCHLLTIRNVKVSNLPWTILFSWNKGLLVMKWVVRILFESLNLRSICILCFPRA
jgi:hypothetical protein